MKKYVLAFDVYGTLINTSGVYDVLVQLVGHKAGLVTELWRNKQLEYSFRRGAMDQYTDFSTCTRDALEYTCLALKMNLETGQKAQLMDAYKVLSAFSEVKVALPRLVAAGHQLFAFSNGSAAAVTSLLKNAEIDVFFDGVVSVEDVKMFKPSPVVYAHFNQKTNSEKTNSWLISGNSFDVIGAATYGMNTAWVQRSPETVFDPWGIEPTIIVHSISELVDNLK